jgi:hypothetical protein
MLFGLFLQLGQLPFQFKNRLFEVEPVFHGAQSSGAGGWRQRDLRGGERGESRNPKAELPTWPGLSRTAGRKMAVKNGAGGVTRRRSHFPTGTSPHRPHFLPAMFLPAVRFRPGQVGRSAFAPLPSP